MRGYASYNQGMSYYAAASQPTIKRLPAYLNVVENAKREGAAYISGTSIAAELNLEPIQVRKDLAVTGIVGTPRVGFPVEQLIELIYRFLHWNDRHPTILIGAGNLGSALMGHSEFRRRGIQIVAAFDTDRAKIGAAIHATTVYPLDLLPKKVHETQARIAILTTPATSAQSVADLSVSAGIEAIWNFTPVRIRTPRRIIVQNEDLSSGYAVLSVRMRLNGTP